MYTNLQFFISGIVREDVFSDLSNGGGYDYILCNPPWNKDSNMKKIKPNYSVTANWVLLALILAKSEAGISFLVPDSFLSSQQDTEIRKILLESSMIDSVVRLPNNLFMNISVSCNLIFINVDNNIGFIIPEDK